MNFFKSLHDTVFSAVTRIAGDWFLPTAARFTFLAVLFFYYVHSASIKVGEGLFGFLDLQFGAYIQILSEAKLVGYDFEIANVPFFEKLIVYAGTYGEFILPVLIILGLFTRFAAVGMIIFVIVQSYVDITAHITDPEQQADTLGAWFDRDSASLIMDQRTLWIFVLLVLVVKGAGALSLDHLLSNWWSKRKN